MKNLEGSYLLEGYGATIDVFAFSKFGSKVVEKFSNKFGNLHEAQCHYMLQ